jgi:hypothetical protein
MKAHHKRKGRETTPISIMVRFSGDVDTASPIGVAVFNVTARVAPIKRREINAKNK